MGDEIYQIKAKKEPLWIEILNISYEEDLKIKKKSILGFLVIEPENVSFKHETKSTKKGSHYRKRGKSGLKKQKKTKKGISI